MGLLDRLSGNGYAVCSQLEKGEKTQLDFDGWGRQTLSGGKNYCFLAIARLKAKTQSLPENSHLSKILSNPRLLTIHVNALFSACEILRVCSQSNAPTKIFDQIIGGARAACIEWQWLFKDYPDDAYRNSIFEFIFRYGQFMLDIFAKQTGTADERVTKAAERGCAALLTQLAEAYPASGDTGIPQEQKDVSAQQNLIFGIVNYYAEMIVKNSNIILLK